MDATEKSKLRRFISDPGLSAAVRAVLLQSFIKERKEADVYKLAAAKLAIDMLQDAWRELERYRIDDEPPERKVQHV